MTATQKLLKPPAPVAERERRIWLLQDGFNSEAYMQDIGVDHSELERALVVAVTGVHVSITAGDYDC